VTEATIVGEVDRPTIRLERQLVDPPSVVWRALTDREELRSWFPCDVIVTGGLWKLGAAISFLFPPEVMDMTLTGEVLAVDEPRALAFRWGEEILRFELTESNGGPALCSSTSCRRRRRPGMPQGGMSVSIGWAGSFPRRTGILDSITIRSHSSRCSAPQGNPPGDHGRG